MDWDYARDLVTVSHDSGVAGPDVFAAAIAELGYEVKPTTPAPVKKARSTLPAQLGVPAEAPPFFVEAIERARSAKRPLVIDFWAEWCVACLRLKRETLEHPEVVKAFRSVELIYVDLDQYPTLGDVYGVAAIPDLIFADKTGRIVDRMQNFEPPEAFVARVRKAFSQPWIRDTTDR